MYGTFLVLHVLSATVWTGGHLVLAMTVLPRVLKDKAPADLLRFEASFERIGLPALFVQIVTGLWLAHRLMPDAAQWFVVSNPVSRLFLTKLLLLAITAVLALDSRLRLIPKLSVGTLPSLAWHIIAVTLVSVLFVMVGVSFRVGWFF